MPHIETGRANCVWCKAKGCVYIRSIYSAKCLFTLEKEGGASGASLLPTFGRGLVRNVERVQICRFGHKAEAVASDLAMADMDYHRVRRGLSLFGKPTQTSSGSSPYLGSQDKVNPYAVAKSESLIG